MKRLLLSASLAFVLPLGTVSAQILDDDDVLFQDVEEQQEENRGVENQDEVKQEEEALDSGEVIERDSTILKREGAKKIGDKEVSEGSTDVEYTSKRRVTETILKEENIPTIQVCESKADINEMDKKDFQALGFDQQAAEKIVNHRQQQGEFKSVDDLSRIQGISQDTLSQLQQDLGVGQKQAEEAKE